MVDERREYFRFSTSWRARVLLADRSLHQVVVTDVSKGGLAIEFPHMLALGTPVNIEFIAPHRGGRVALRAKTVVTHHTLLSGGRGARLGLKFLIMDKDNSHTFSNILQELTDKLG